MHCFAVAKAWFCRRLQRNAWFCCRQSFVLSTVAAKCMVLMSAKLGFVDSCSEMHGFSVGKAWFCRQLQRNAWFAVGKAWFCRQLQRNALFCCCEGGWVPKVPKVAKVPKSRANLYLENYRHINICVCIIQYKWQAQGNRCRLIHVSCLVLQHNATAHTLPVTQPHQSRTRSQR